MVKQIIIISSEYRVEFHQMFHVYKMEATAVLLLSLLSATLAGKYQLELSIN